MPQTIAPENMPVDAATMGALQQLMQSHNAQVSGAAQNQSSGQGQNYSSTTNASVPIATPQPNQQSPGFQVAPQMNGKKAQSRADMGALINNIQGLIHTAAKNQQQKQVAVATNNWNRLMTAMQNPNDSQNKLIIQSILGDPKILKQMSKALNIDWLNPSKGADNVYRQALSVAAKTHQAKQGALGALKSMLGLGSSDANLNPQQKQQLASQMQARFPATPQNPDILKTQITSKLYSQILNNPAGIGAGVDSLSEVEKEFLGIGPNANEVLRAQVQESIANQKEADAAAKLAEKTKVDQEKIDQKDRALNDANTRFAATQQRLSTALQSNLLIKTAELKQRFSLAKTAQDRAKIASSIADNQNNANKIKLLDDTLASADKQLQIETTKLKNLQTAYKSQSGSLTGFLSKDSGITAEGQAAIDSEQKIIDALQSHKAVILQQQSDLLDQLSKPIEPATKAPDKAQPTKAPDKAQPTKANPLGLDLSGIK